VKAAKQNIIHPLKFVPSFVVFVPPQMAVGIHKNILGYMGDKTTSCPALLAKDILQKGLETPALVDEIYLQVGRGLSRGLG
jgi:hypothetical protein